MKIKYADIEIASGEDFQSARKKVFESKEVSIWLARLNSKLRTEGVHYFEEKQRLIQEHALKYESDGEERKGNRVVRSWKKGDIVSDEKGVKFANAQAFLNALAELQQFEITISDMDRISSDLETTPPLSPAEIEALMHFVEVKE